MSRIEARPFPPFDDPTPRRVEVTSEPVTFRRVLTSEWIKFKTLRSTWAVLGAAVIGMFLLALLIAYNTRHLTPIIQANDAAPSGPLQGYYLGQLLIGSLGVLFVSGEYSTGMIRSTLTAVPRRLPVLWAKVLVFSAVTAVSMVIISVVSFVAAEAFVSRYRTGYSLGDPGVLRVVIGTGVYLTLMGLIGAALAWIIRSTPGALVAYVAVLLILPVLFGEALGNWGKDVAQYLPSSAGASFSTSIREAYTLAPWTGGAVMVLWVVVALAVAATVLRRRDA